MSQPFNPAEGIQHSPEAFPGLRVSGGAGQDEEAKLRAIVENASDTIFVKDLTGRYTLINPAGAAVFGLDPEQILGRRDEDLFDVVTSAQIETTDRRVLATDAPLTYEEMIPQADGELSCFLSTKYLLRGPDGETTGLIGISRDITERKRIEQQLVRANVQNALRSDVSDALARLGTLPELLTACLDAIVRHMGVTFARVWMLNPAEQMLEVQASAGDVPDGPGVKRIPVGAMLVGVIAQTRQSIMTNQAQDDPRLAPMRAYMLEYGLVSFAGCPLLVDDRLVGVASMFSREPLSAFTMEVLATVTDTIAQGLERKRLEDELRRQNEQLKALDEMKSVFVSAVSHELRTPLTSIRGYAEFMEDGIGGELSVEHHAYVEQIQLGAERLQRLVDDLLDFARLESGAFRLDVQPADMAVLARRVADGFRPQLTQSGLTLSVVVSAPVTAMRLDPARIGQVLVVLIDNAIKFTPAGGTLTLSVDAVPTGLRVSVRDSGIGIGEADMLRLFERFYQVDAALTREKGGTGLGLSIARALVEAHGGRIGVDSTPGEGSTFWFELPIS